jgi:oxygen-dependent protoporphyrinogen oxidase
MFQVAIVGGGISGLATAWYLSRAGIPSCLIEARPRLGGVITTDIVDGCLIEGGPDSFLAAKPWAADLIAEAGLSEDLIASNDHLRVTYIWKRDRLVPLPDGLMMMVPTRVWPMLTTRLLSWSAKVRIGIEYFRRRPSTPLADRSVAEFVASHYGQEVVDYLAEPLLSGVYGGDPAELSVESVLPRFVELEARYGSLTRGVLAVRRKVSNSGPLFQTLRYGLGSLIDRLEDRLGHHCQILHGTVTSIEAAERKSWRLHVEGQWLAAEHVVLACPAYAAGALLTGAAPELSALLTSIPYSSSMTVALGYRRSDLKHPLNGFGFLVPKRDRERLIACTWVGVKFPYRVPDDYALLRCFLGGAGDEAILSESDESVLSIVRGELRRIMGVSARPAFFRISRWPRSMAQYTVGHAKRVREIQDRLKALPNLYLAGNAYSGIGIPDCVRSGKLAAEAIVSTLRAQSALA